jgi:hypothetical protein
LLHQLLQRIGVDPEDVLYKFRPGKRAFYLASMRVQLEAEEKALKEQQEGVSAGG